MRSPAAACRRGDRVRSVSGEVPLPSSYASGTRWLPVSLGLFLPESRGLLISFQALNHFAVPKKSVSNARTAKDGKVAQQTQA